MSNQFLQNSLGRLLVRVLRAEKAGDYYKTSKIDAGITLGEYIIIPLKATSTTLDHERGHRLQSRRLGILYLFKVGIPSIVCNIYDRLFHTNWSVHARIKWYYSLPWEKEADKLGGVKRNK